MEVLAAYVAAAMSPPPPSSVRNQNLKTFGSHDQAARNSYAREHFKSTPDGSPICPYYNKVGHVMREFRKRKFDLSRGGRQVNNVQTQQSN